MAEEASDDAGAGPEMVAGISNDPFEAANLLRKSHGIRVTGGQAPAPLVNFNDLSSRYKCSKRLMAKLEEHGWHEPTAIQRQAIPILLEGRELFAVAPTGSGKTLAFLLPIIAALHQKKYDQQRQQQQHQQQQQEVSGSTKRTSESAEHNPKASTKFSKPSEASSMLQSASKAANSTSETVKGKSGKAEGSVEASKGPSAVILAPSRELAAQTARCLLLLLKGLKLRCTLLTAAVAAGTDFSKMDLVVATPKRLSHLVKAKQVDLASVQFLILDEADKLFELGFVSHIDRIILACSNPHIIRGLFSATLPEGVEEMASSVLQMPLRLVVGPRNAPTSAVSQRLMFVGREGGKILGLRQLIAKGLTPPVLLFVSSKERAEAVHRQVMYDGVHADVIHSSQPQSVRNAAVDRFRSGASWLLVATDLVGRGMDFLGVHTVINYDFPQSTIDYIHRVGRTGRAGRSGEAITFYTEDDAWQLRSIVNVMRAAGCEVPDWMLQLKKERRKSHSKKDYESLAKVGKQSVNAKKAARG
ncbi:TPA: RNA-dependent ATPase rok1 [Trebouxia sp. C0004]